MDANLIDFYAGTNSKFVDRVIHLIKHWRIGTTANLCKTETDLAVVTMYLYFLERVGGTRYTTTESQITNIIYQTINILNITNITEVDATTIINNVYNSIVNNYTIVEGTTIEHYEANYAGIGIFTVAVAHNLGTMTPIVEIYEDTGLGTLERVYPEIEIVDDNNLNLNFTSTSSGKYTIVSNGV